MYTYYKYKINFSSYCKIIIVKLELMLISKQFLLLRLYLY